ncbi:MAG: SPOR domain-containing protein [Robiginitalea sp.]
MQLERHIADLLYRYQCVVIPGFGAFLSQIKSASLQKDSNTFYPPFKELSFNARLNTNDGLLVSHIAQAEGESYETALEKVTSQSQRWKEKLKSGAPLELPGLGVFRLNREEKMVFEPDNRTNYLMSSYGLSPVIGNPVVREVLKEEVTELEERIPFTITPEARGQNRLRPVLKYAAVVLLALATGLSSYSLYQRQLTATAVAHEEAQKEVSRQIQEATFFDAAPVELPSVSLEVTQKAPPIHHVIAGAYRYRENADKRIQELILKGYPAHYLGQNDFGLHHVAFASFSDAGEALENLKEIRRRESPDVWLLSKR